MPKLTMLNLMAMLSIFHISQATADSVHGSGSHQGWIGPHASVAYDEGFIGGKEAVVTLNGWDDSNLDLFIYDENENMICESISLTSSEYCKFVPKWTGAYTIIITNNGATANEYALWTN